MAQIKGGRSYEARPIPGPPQRQTHKRAVSYTILPPPPTYEQVEKLDALPDREAIPPPPQTSIVYNPETAVGGTLVNLISQINCTDPSGHSPKRQFGKIGIIAGVVFFPWGLFWTRCDFQVICKSCHTILEPKGSKRHCREMTYSGRRHGRCGYGKRC